MMERDPSLQSLETTLERNFPGLEVLDRDLELSERFRADIVAVERSGRLVLVILVEAEGDEPLLASLEALAFARHNAPVLAAHFEEPRLRTDQAPRVLLIAQTFTPELLARLRPLLDRSVELFEVRRVKSARGENLFLAAIGGEPQVLAAASTSEDAFLARLAPDQHAIAKHCLERMARIDDELRLGSSAGRLTWSFRGSELARLELHGDLLNGSAAPDHASRALRSPAQVDFFVEEVLGRYVASLGLAGGAGRAATTANLAGAPPGPSRAPASRPEVTAARAPRVEDDFDEPDEFEHRPSPPEQGGLLTPEELRAFQE